MSKDRLFVATLVIMVLSAGCRSHTSPAGGVNPVSPVAARTDAWLGRWDGPEGTYLRLAKRGDMYLVQVKDLDGLRTFEGFADGNRIRFTRDGNVNFLSEGDGRATGMKWLVDKKDCLLIRAGEGWCRD